MKKKMIAVMAAAEGHRQQKPAPLIKCWRAES